jgi:hypothetical protein
MRYSPKYKKWYDDRYYYSREDAKEYEPSKRKFYAKNHNWSSKNPLDELYNRVRTVRYMEQRSATNNRNAYKYRTCESGYTVGQGYGGLYKAWMGFLINKYENNLQGMIHYAEGIRRMEKDMKLDINEFPELLQAASEYVNNPENEELLEEEAERRRKDPDELTSEEILNIMLNSDMKNAFSQRP